MIEVSDKACIVRIDDMTPFGPKFPQILHAVPMVFETIIDTVGNGNNGDYRNVAITIIVEWHEWQAVAVIPLESDAGKIIFYDHLSGEALDVPNPSSFMVTLTNAFNTKKAEDEAIKNQKVAAYLDFMRLEDELEAFN